MIRAQKCILATHDRPDVLGADNGHFGSHLFKQFAEQWYFENMLLEHINTPLKHIGYLPSQLLMSRVCKTKLHTRRDILQPHGPDPKKIVRNRELQKGLRCSSYGRASKELSVLQPEQSVIMRDTVMNRWESEQIVRETTHPRSDIVRNRRRHELRSNRIDLKESEASVRSPDEEDVLKDEVEQLSGEQADPLLINGEEKSKDVYTVRP
ncbi:hypothetical protein PR048_025115 [Dryococelus australis]|uniref:Uncharacterized protein n=1 Tax=Dryococelus australis TaxID=614101 RepID=A0ABQ9GQG0_9NEOP|nr:hypothetical protein PR048_025115 [Dryococelus australis]